MKWFKRHIERWTFLFAICTCDLFRCLDDIRYEGTSLAEEGDICRNETEFTVGGDWK